jgi:N-dimethylarginine dimethylaminohydrolase
MVSYSSQSEASKIQSILLKHPKDAFISQSNVDNQWEELNYSGCPEYEKALIEYEDFVSLLESDIPEVLFLPVDNTTGLDSIYVRDSIVITKQGAILCNMGKALRQGETSAVGRYLEQLGIPVLGAIAGKGRLEGGDVIWLDEDTLIVGEDYRTNAEGIRQLRELTATFINELVVVPLPRWRGPEDVFHLMSIISPVDVDLAVVYSKLLPIPFYEMLIEHGIQLLDVTDAEFASMGCNVLAIAPRRCIVLSGNPNIKRKLENAGADVFEYVGEEISRKGAGGPTCLTRPIQRL